MSISIRSRLGTMMFIQYMGMGVFMPMMGHYLKWYLALDPMRVGVILAMPAIAAFLSPLVVIHVADRWLPAERLLATLHFLACGALVILWMQQDFWPFLFAYLLFWLVFSPTLAMTNTVAFHHLTDARRDFGSVRMWGTISWVIVGFLFGLLWLRGGGSDPQTSRLPHGFIVAAGVSVLMGLYAMTLPIAEQAHPTERPSPWRALSVFRKSSMIILCAVTFVNTVLNMFYVNWMSPYLSQEGFGDGWILPLLSLGQVSEILVIGGLGRFIRRVGLKGALLIGLAAQATRFVIFALNPAALLLAFAIGLHGITYGCFFIVAMIYVDNHCDRSTRASAQLLLNTVIGGLGNLAGSLCAGFAAQFFAVSETNRIDYERFWTVPAVACVALVVVFVLSFREQSTAPD